MNNRTVRAAMAHAGIKQYQLAEILDCSESSVSMLLKHELSRSEQKRIVGIIKEYEARNEAADKDDTSADPNDTGSVR